MRSRKRLRRGFTSHISKLKALVLIAVAVLPSACTTSVEQHDNTQNAKSDERQVVHGTPANQVPPETTTLKAAQSALEHEYAVKPDQRFVNAFKNAYKLVFEKESDVYAEHLGNCWVVHCGTREAARLSNYPDFSEQFQQLLSWTNTLVEEKALSLSPETIETAHIQVANPAPDDLFAASEKCDNIWRTKKYTANSMKQWTKALAWLSFENFDFLNRTDGSVAKSLAVTALTEVLTKESRPTEKWLLADSLGYTRNANLLKTKIVAADPVSKCIKQNFDFDNHDSFVRLLRCKYLSDAHNFKQLDLCIGNEFPADTQMRLPLLALLIKAKPDDSSIGLLIQLILDIQNIEHHKQLEQLPQISSMRWTRKRIEDSLQWLPNSIAKYQETPTASQEKSNAENFREAYFYSALTMLIQKYCEVDASFFSKPLSALGGTGEVVDYLQRWMTIRREISNDSDQQAEISRFISDSIQFGSFCPASLLDAWTSDKYFRPMDPDFGPSMLRSFIGCSDSRPTSLRSLATVADRPFWNAWAANFYFDQLARLNNSLKLETDTTYVTDPLGYVRSPDHDLADKLKFLAILERVESGTREIDAYYSELIRLYPNSAEVRTLYALNKLYSRSSSLQTTAQELQRWLVSAKDLTTAEKTKGYTALADIYYYLQATKSMESAAQQIADKTSDVFVRLQIKICVLRMDRNKARSWCEGLLEKHVTIANLTTVIQAFWALDMFDEAAQVVSQHRSVLSEQIWDTRIAAAFAKVFEKQQNKIDAALKPLMEKGFANSQSMVDLAHGLRAHKHTALAFKVCLTTLDKASIDQVTWMYACLKETRGIKPALLWMKDRLQTDEQRCAVAIPAFISGEDELLWTLVPLDPTGPDSEIIWLLRASMLEKPTEIQLKQIQAAIARKKSLTAKLTAFMLNQKDEKLSVENIRSDELSLVAFFKGWNMLREGTQCTPLFEQWQIAQQTQPPDRYHQWAAIWCQTMQRAFGYSTFGITSDSRLVQVVKQSGSTLSGRDVHSTTDSFTTYGGGCYEFVSKKPSTSTFSSSNK